MGDKALRLNVVMSTIGTKQTSGCAIVELPQRFEIQYPFTVKDHFASRCGSVATSNHPK